MSIIDDIFEERRRRAEAANPYLLPPYVGGYIVTSSYEALKAICAETGLPVYDFVDDRETLKALFGVPIIIDELASSVTWYHH